MSKEFYKTWKDLRAGEKIYILENLKSFYDGQKIKLIRYSPKIKSYVIIYFKIDKSEFKNFK